ncbi:transketolase [Aliidongia dinghuensis]|uniref:Transketolase n=1 Tax=Aliidongia dinghuensis TaxID=1867774 RepID=A0A8J2YSY7_9PROT|nr:transketolase [Aliidongia dinghuensis]GGF16733.1 transketolase [Aliidongia dinghuensis]
MSSSDTTTKPADLTPLKQDPTYGRMANALRALAMDAVEAANSGHPGMPMGMADAATVLFAEHLKFDPSDPHWPDRDRFVLSAGHGSMLLYGLLHLTGYPGVTLDEIKHFRQLGHMTAGHPEYGHIVGAETTTGPLGQGISNAVGMAMAERLLNARFGDALVDHHTYVIAGDGCLMEGISHEALSIAGHYKLGRLIVLWDDNSISIDGSTDLAVSDDQKLRFEAHGWHVQQVDGHDPHAVSKAIAAAKAVTDKPSMIACKTTIGLGAPSKAGTAGVHGAALGAKEIEGARIKLNWPHEPFEVPDDIRAQWQAVAARGAEPHAAWRRRHAAADPALREAFDRQIAGELTPGWETAVHGIIAKFAAERPKIATRQASQLVLDALAPVLPELLGGSADLTGSNLTKVKSQAVVTAKDFSGSYVHWGVREHGMAAAMNGISVHGGLVPYGGTFLVFADYSRPSIRLSALMGIRVIHVMTHDSIGLGEDGPTHQPVETLPALRAIPNLLVFRPADPIETAECWALALQHKTRPSVLALSRQGIPTVRSSGAENSSSRGGYVLAPASGPRKATLLASGTEVSLALAAREKLEAEGIPTAVVSMPCWELFAEQTHAYRTEVLGETENRVAVEAAVEFGWERWIGPKGRFVGMKGFGASGPADKLYQHFGITVEAVVAAAKEGL